MKQDGRQQQALQQCEGQLLAIFSELQQGRDVAPATRYRIEGYLAALVAMDVLSEAQAAATIDQAWRQVFTTEPVRDANSPLSIPVVMPRAPVYPSTQQEA